VEIERDGHIVVVIGKEGKKQHSAHAEKWENWLNED